ncbi:hypothetical protein QFZ91_000608 [Paraburkholderia sp. JPY419]
MQVLTVKAGRRVAAPTIPPPTQSKLSLSRHCGGFQPVVQPCLAARGSRGERQITIMVGSVTKLTWSWARTYTNELVSSKEVEGVLAVSQEESE